MFWLREVGGWLLTGLGLTAFSLAAWLLLLGSPIEASMLLGIGFIVFRGGLHLLKVAAAVRLCRLAVGTADERGPTFPGARRPGRTAVVPPATPRSVAGLPAATRHLPGRA